MQSGMRAMRKQETQPLPGLLPLHVRREVALLDEMRVRVEVAREIVQPYGACGLEGHRVFQVVRLMLGVRRHVPDVARLQHRHRVVSTLHAGGAADEAENLLRLVVVPARGIPAFRVDVLIMQCFRSQATFHRPGTQLDRQFRAHRNGIFVS